MAEPSGRMSMNRTEQNRTEQNTTEHNRKKKKKKLNRKEENRTEQLNRDWPCKKSIYVIIFRYSKVHSRKTRRSSPLGAKPNLYCEAMELVCGGSPKDCVLVVRKALDKVKLEL